MGKSLSIEAFSDAAFFRLRDKSTLKVRDSRPENLGGRARLRWDGRVLLDQLLAPTLARSQARDREARPGRSSPQAHAEGDAQWIGIRQYRDLFARLAHVHDDDDAQVVIRADRAVDHADDRQPDQVRLAARR